MDRRPPEQRDSPLWTVGSEARLGRFRSLPEHALWGDRKVEARANSAFVSRILLEIDDQFRNHSAFNIVIMQIITIRHIQLCRQRHIAGLTNLEVNMSGPSVVSAHCAE